MTLPSPNVMQQYVRWLSENWFDHTRVFTLFLACGTSHLSVEAEDNPGNTASTASLRGKIRTTKQLADHSYETSGYRWFIKRQKVEGHPTTAHKGPEGE